MLPPDGHVHSEWSWDAPAGSMEQTCARAVDLGLPSIAFTDHADFTSWDVGHEARLPAGFRCEITREGVLIPPALDVTGYLECLQRCRDRFPSLRILSGVELSEPHWHGEAVAALLAHGDFDRVLGSVHTVCTEDGRYLPADDAYRELPATEVLREYLAEVTRMVEQADSFVVLAHIDYPIRRWPLAAGPHDPRAYEADYRAALRALARTGSALEINTRVPLDPQIVRWWHEEGGDAVTFGSDAHDPDSLARDFPDAAAMAEANGFRPGHHPHDLWRRD